MLFLIFAEKLNGMRKLLFITLCFFIVGCAQNKDVEQPPRKLLKEIVIDHSVTDSAYTHYGLTKEVYRIYNCEYEEVDYKEERTQDTHHGIRYFLNSYGDTVRITYTDYTNYPRREE